MDVDMDHPTTGRISILDSHKFQYRSDIHEHITSSECSQLREFQHAC